MLSIVTVLFGTESEAWRQLPRIKAMHEALDGNLEWIIVNNASRRRPVGISEPWIRTMTFDNIGFGAAFNRGAILASGEYLLSLNTDIHFDDEFISLVAERVKTRSSNLMAPPLTTGSETVLGQRAYTYSSLLSARLTRQGSQRAETDAPHKVAWVLGACFLVRRDLFASTGGFDEGYFLYFEDVDFCQRWRRRGLEIEIIPIPVLHAHRRSSRRLGRPLYWHIRSGLRYAVKQRGDIAWR